MTALVPAIVKENPLKSLAAFLSSVAVVLSAVFTVDTRYAHAKEVETLKKDAKTQILELQRSNLDDKVFELEIRKSTKPKEWSSTDQLMLERYKTKMEAVEKQQNREK
jgi:hypothetical protein